MSDQTPDDAARAEAERLYSDKMYAYHAYLRGHRDARARIAARRDKVVEAIATYAVETWGAGAMVILDDYSSDRDGAPSFAALQITDAVLAALGVDRG